MTYPKWIFLWPILSNVGASFYDLSTLFPMQRFGWSETNYYVKFFKNETSPNNHISTYFVVPYHNSVGGDRNSQYYIYITQMNFLFLKIK